MTRRSFAAVAAVVALLALALPSARGDAAPVLTTGAVIALRGTPHLFIADSNGIVHWAGDTRGLRDRYVDWNTRSEVSVDELKTLLRGDPWLSAGLLKNGDPIYLVKWEASEAKPTLLRIQSIQDVEIFGINGNNYGSLVLDRAVWEQRFGFSFDSLQKGELAAAVSASPTPTASAATQSAATATPSGLSVALREVTYTGDNDLNYRFTTRIDVSGIPPRSRVKVSLVGREYNCSPSCDDTKPVRWGPTDAFGDANAAGTLLIEDTHNPYSEYTYTVTDSLGRTATLRVDDDFKKL